MRFLILLSLIAFPAFEAMGRDPGTGSNTTISGPGPATPDAGSSDTSVMGGGTPGNEGMDTLNIRNPTEEDLEIMRQEEKRLEEERKNQTVNPD